MDNNINNNLNNDVLQSGTSPIAPLDQTNTIMFDPMTGQPVTQIEPMAPTTSLNGQVTSEPLQEVNTETPQQNNNVTNNVNNAAQIQSELQSIPTVEQGKEAFINNVQSMNQEKKEEKKEGVNFVFIIILFVVILVAIFFLFPLLLDYI